MTRRGSIRVDQQRQAVAQEAARIMAEQGVEDFLLAKRKAAERLMVTDTAALPRNAEIEAALLEHQRLFHAERHVQQLQQLRDAALRVMRLLAEFKPHLVGSVLTGSVGAHAEINLHVFADHPEQVALRLEERGIVPRHAQKKVRFEADRQVSYPSFQFVGGQQAVEIIVFPIDGIRQAPNSPVDGRPMQRADMEAVVRLLQ